MLMKSIQYACVWCAQSWRLLWTTSKTSLFVLEMKLRHTPLKVVLPVGMLHDCLVCGHLPTTVPCGLDVDPAAESSPVCWQGC